MKLNRKQFIWEFAVFSGSMAFFPTKLFAENERSIQKIIQQIGNTNGEKERAELIEKFLNSKQLSPEEHAVFLQFFTISDRWINGKEKYANPGSEGNEGSGYLCGFLGKCKIDRFYFPKLEETNPLFPLIAFYRSRMLLAHLIQNGEISMVPENREMYINESVRLLKIAQQSFPENNLIKAYLGDYKPWAELVEFNPKAPDWANYQRMVLEKLTYLIHWWIDNRQISDGQFGGGWGDDVEMWRSWVPVLFAFNDEKATQSQELLFEGLYGLSKMEKGYTTAMNDVEHTSEEYSDPLTCMLTLQPENKVWEERALKVLDYIENVWSGINQRGQLQFKSTWFNVEKVHDDKKRACDSPYHTRLVQPLMLLWLRTGNKRIERFMLSWLKTWVDATFSEESGKPKGIVPAAIHWPDGTPSGGKNWWEPENYHTPLYHYPSQQENMYECFLQAFYLTQNEFYLKPIRFMAQKRLEGIGEKSPDNYTAGTLEWAVAAFKGSLPGLLIKYRLISGDNSFDSILKKDARRYEKFLFEKNSSDISESLYELKKSLSLAEEFFTTEVRWTDRLFAFTGKYFNYILDTPLPTFDAGFLFSSLTGSIGNFKFLPVFGVQWLSHSKQIAALTKTNHKNEFEADLFHFGNTARKMGARFFNLENGNYQVEIDNEVSFQKNINEHNREIEFSVSAQKLTTLKLTKTNSNP